MFQVDPLDDGESQQDMIGACVCLACGGDPICSMEAHTGPAVRQRPWPVRSLARGLHAVAMGEHRRDGKVVDDGLGMMLRGRSGTGRTEG